MGVIPSDEQRPAEMKLTERHIEFTPVSNLYFYPTSKPIGVRPFTVLDLSALANSSKSGSLRQHMAAIGRTLSEIDVGALTVGDFDHIRYWHRINSYPTRPYTIPWECDHEDHRRYAAMSEEELQAEFNDKEKPAEKLSEYFKDMKNSAKVTKDSLILEEITEDKISAIADLLNKVHDTYGIWLYPETMADLLAEQEIHEAVINKEKARLRTAKPSELDALIEDLLDNQQDEMIAECARNIRNVQDNQTFGSLQEKIQYLVGRIEAEPELFGTEFVFLIREFKDLTAHGVHEQINATCGRCGNQTQLHVELDIAHFFP